jgi:hypothetical protein
MFRFNGNEFAAHDAKLKDQPATLDVIVLFGAIEIKD